MNLPILKGSGIGSALLMVDCGIGDDIAALPGIVSLCQKEPVTIYTKRTDIFENIPNVTLITVRGLERKCSNGELLDMDWDRKALEQFETIYKLNNWPDYDPLRKEGTGGPRMALFAEHLGVEMPEQLEWAQWLGATPSIGDYVLLSLEAHLHYRTYQKSREVLDSLIRAGEKVVWLTEFPNSRREAKRCKSTRELIDLIAGAKRVISVDTGPAHVAAVLGKKLTIIAGLTDGRGIFEQYNNPDITYIQGTYDECDGPCYALSARGFKSQPSEKLFARHEMMCCGKYKNPKCLETISPEQIITIST